MDLLPWSVILVGGILAGLGLVGMLILSREFEPVAMLVGLGGAAVAGYGIFHLAGAYQRPDITVAGVALSLAAVGGGYGLGSALLGTLATRTPRLSLPETIEPQSDEIAVILVTSAEPARYDPRATALELASLADAGLVEATIGITPFLYAAQKARYRAAGGSSPSFAQARALAERLHALLVPDERFGPVEFVTCTSGDTLERAIVGIAERGLTRVVAAELTVGESYALDRSKSRVDALRPQASGLRIAYTPALWGAEPLTQLVADRVWAAREEPERTGVALILHGQPEARERAHGNFDTQENAFANRIRMILADRGIPEANVRLCYAEWRDPDITETVRHLAALGCRRVLVCPACFPFEAVMTILDFAVAVRQARVDTHVNTITLSAWGDDPIVADVLYRSILRAVEELR